MVAPKRKSPRKAPKAKEIGEPIPMPAPGGSCCPDCAGKPSGTMGACEDGACYDIPPPTGPGNGPFVLTVVKNINNGLPYWEDIANLTTPAPAAQSGKG